MYPRPSHQLTNPQTRHEEWAQQLEGLESTCGSCEQGLWGAARAPREGNVIARQGGTGREIAKYKEGLAAECHCADLTKP